MESSRSFANNYSIKRRYRFARKVKPDSLVTRKKYRALPSNPDSRLMHPLPPHNTCGLCLQQTIVFIMYKDIIQLLDQRRLKEAFAQLSSLASETDNWKLTSEVENLQTTYGYMLQYAAQGVDDPDRGKMYAQLRRRGYELADRAGFLKDQQKASGYFADKFRGFKKVPPHTFLELRQTLEGIAENISVTSLMIAGDEKKSMELKVLNIRNQKVIDELFDKIWTSTQWTEEEYNEAMELLSSPLISVNALAVMTSAVTLSLMKLFDLRKFQFLMQTYHQRTETVITQRALIGVLLAAYYQETRLSLYPELTASLALWEDNTEITEQIYNIQILFLLSRETEKVDKKMREEIIPQMMQNPHLKNPNLKIIDIEEWDEKNPEWEKSMEIISDRIRQLNELQMEGVDTYMSTFSMLKSYPFFRQAAHWFYLFDFQTPDIAGLFNPKDINNQSIVGTLLDSPMFCNSDKYSFCLTLNSLPPSQRSILDIPLDEQNEMSQEKINKLISKVNGREGTNVVSRQYVHDLYRFFKLWTYRNEQHDPFTDELTFWKSPFLRPMLRLHEHRKQIADYLFTKNYLQEAIELYEEIIQAHTEDADVWQKLGFSFQKMKRYEDAVNAYRQADILKPDHVWTLKHLAQCYKRMHDYEKALDYFYRVEAIQPDNLSLLLQIGQCLAAERDYSKALQYFFKVEYLDKTPDNARRAIGWCYFMTGKYEDALRFYEKLLQSEEVQTTDWLNTGHVYTAMNLIPKALECYREVEKRTVIHSEFMKIYLADKEALLEQGVTEENIYLIPDLL